MKKTLSANDIRSILFLTDTLHFSNDLIDYLLQYCVQRGKKDFRYIEKVAIGWHDMHITTVEQAQAHIKQIEDKWIKIKNILSYLGIKNGEIMKPQEDMLNKWISTYNFTMPLIQKACDICFERLNRADFKYIDGILSNWYKNNIKTLEDVATKDKQFKNNYNKTKQQANNVKPNKFNNFEPRSYDYDSLEKKLLGWDSDE